MMLKKLEVFTAKINTVNIKAWGSDKKSIKKLMGSRDSVSPIFDAAKIALIYGVLGGLWISFSDRILSSAIEDTQKYAMMQTYKGWIFVGITMVILFLLIGKRMCLFKYALDMAAEENMKLAETNKKLGNAEEELRVKMEKLRTKRQALVEIIDMYRKERQLADNIINNVAVLVAIWDKNGRVKRINPYAEKLLGYTQDEIAGRNWVDVVVSSEDQEFMRGVFEKVRSGQTLKNHESRIMDRNGNYVDILWNSSVLHNNDGAPTEIISLGTDITQRKALEKKLHSLAYYDELTGLSNRVMFENYMRDLLEINGDSKESFALVYMDTDNFKHINDTYGHFAGDILLKHIAGVLKEQVVSPDRAVRLGGDEFAIILTGISSKVQIQAKLDSLVSSLRKPWIIGEHEFLISFSMGIAVYPEHGEDMTTLLKNADTAMFSVKEKGKDSYAFYSQQMQEKNLKHIDMINQLRRAIENEEFLLHYQPKIHLESGRIIGAEALIRWLHPEKGFIPPNEFIPLAEQTGQIKEIGAWVLKNALEQKKVWNKMGYENLKLSINLSGRQLSEESMAEDIGELLKGIDMDCNGVELEITETAVMTDLEAAVETLGKLRELGFRIALDDFGTGYSSLTYLKKLPMDTVKMDRRFIKNIESDDADKAIIEAVIQMANSLKKHVVAEGIETISQLEFLRKVGCGFGQGFLFSKPVTAREFEGMMLRVEENMKLVNM
ncbi:MAG: EAL domain-containing protein [Peptoclostridium sp.]|uniref:putative bifunctional diguanylate cyclase/phosphodiesterase n=1 Tax=Peptoclostridium sp. TaxID=1904860 RepID=UPI00139F0278|nr:EAL domain-containing protein [Peptoclostridium sp.]MZQ74552.1 EAL domain-containing protein [Peptoclostridium sp.]